MTQSEIVEQIHQEFYTSGEKELESLNISLNQTAPVTKAHRLAKLGFSQASPVKEYTGPTKQTIEHKISLIMLYQSKYPNYKFISEHDVERICKKYKLVHGPVSQYIGDVPEEQLDKIEQATVSRDDKYVGDFLVKKITYYLPERDANGIIKIKDYLERTGNKIIASDSFTTTHPINGKATAIAFLSRVIGKYDRESTTYMTDEHLDGEFINTGLSIVAPKSDFKMEGFSLLGHKLMQKVMPIQETLDPVVMERVKGGYLILAAWGPEASDEIVVNNKMN